MNVTQNEILSASRFYVELGLAGSKEPHDGIFLDCSGFQTQQDEIKIFEVTPQPWGKSGSGGPMAKSGSVMLTKIPGNINVTNITLKRALSVSMTLWAWLSTSHRGAWAESNSDRSWRRNGILRIYKADTKVAVTFEFRRAWPVRYKISDLSATKSEFVVEEVELAVEELARQNVT